MMKGKLSYEAPQMVTYSFELDGGILSGSQTDTPTGILGGFDENELEG